MKIQSLFFGLILGLAVLVPLETVFAEFWSLTGNAGTDPAPPTNNFLGTTDDQPVEIRVNNERALRLEPNAGSPEPSPNLIGGFNGNEVTSGSVGATIGGGGSPTLPNRITHNYGTVGGGIDNQVGGLAATVGGGESNEAGSAEPEAATSNYATIGGGQGNKVGRLGGAEPNSPDPEDVDVNHATIGGGHANKIGVLAGQLQPDESGPERVRANFITISGGQRNEVGISVSPELDTSPIATETVRSATIGGGEDNRIFNAFGATIGGGLRNLANGGESTIGGGSGNLTRKFASTVSGGFGNKATAKGATVAGGGRFEDFDTSTGNRATDAFGTVGGGADNQAGNNDGDSLPATRNANYNTVSGGLSNEASGEAGSTVGGGGFNTASENSATVGGGFSNTASGAASMVGGGRSNTASENSSTVGGGSSNEASGIASTIGGGRSNAASRRFATVGGGNGNSATGNSAHVGGGSFNLASHFWSAVGGGLINEASGVTSTVAGGLRNIAIDFAATVGGGTNHTAGGRWSTVPGGFNNEAHGDYSLAAGRQANARHPGSFVWGDSTSAFITSSQNDQFTARASGGVRFFSNSTLTSGVRLFPGASAWSSVSDEGTKADYAPVNGRDILIRLAALPIQSWNYKSQDPSIRHIGPTAQDFYGAFGVGESNNHISTVDADGIAMAAIQGLYQVVQEKDEQIAAQQTRIETLEARLSRMEQAIERIGNSVGLSAAEQ